MNPVDAVMLARSLNITFHGIGRAGRPLEPGEQDVWVTRDQFLGILDRAQFRPNVSITFDDGNLSDLEHALPALQSRGLRGTFFVVAGRMGMSGFLDADDVRTLADAGMEIGCHGMRHRPWRGLDADALHEELVQAKAILEDVVAGPVTRAACPFGSYDRRVLRGVRQAGYDRIYTSDRGPARAGAFVQARTSIGPEGRPELLDGAGVRSSPGRRAKLAVKRWR